MSIPSQNQVPSRPSRRRKRFRPRLWSALLTIAGCGVFIALGVWQIDRGQQKARLDAQMAAARKGQLRDLAALPDSRLPPAPQVLAVRASGRYLADAQLLLDQQSQGDQAGYDVLTPLQLADGGLVIVDRGWRPGDPHDVDPAALAVSTDSRSVKGLWRALTAPGLRLDAHNCRPQPWPRIVFYPDTRDLACIYGQPVRAGVLLLDPAQPDGFVRRWRVGDVFPPMRHYAYAAQWFGFGALAVFLFFVLNRKVVDEPL